MQSSQVAARYGLSDLSSCTSGSSCASFVIQIVISSAIIIWLVIEFVMRIKSQMRPNFSWQEIMLLQMFLCLGFDICFSADAKILIWFLLQNLFFHLYFTTLVYYFCKKYVEKKINHENRRVYIITMIVVYTIFCLAELGIFIYLVNAGLKHCKQLFEIIIEGIMIMLGIIVFYIAYQNETEERKKFQEFKVRQYIQNPLKEIWIWIGLNIFGQICGELQSILIYLFYSGYQWSMQNNLQNDILGPIFQILIYVSSFCSTLWFYNRRRVMNEESVFVSFTNLQLSSAQGDFQNNIQIIKPSTNSGSSFLNEDRHENLIEDKMNEPFIK